MTKTGNLTKKTVEYNLEKLKAKGFIKRIGPAKGGHWKVVRIAFAVPLCYGHTMSYKGGPYGNTSACSYEFLSFPRYG